MTTVLSQKGQVVLPAPLRKRLDLQPGDDLEIQITDEDTIVLKRINQRSALGLVGLLQACPPGLTLPEREHDLPPPVAL